MGYICAGRYGSHARTACETLGAPLNWGAEWGLRQISREMCVFVMEAPLSDEDARIGVNSAQEAHSEVPYTTRGASARQCPRGRD